MGITENPDTVVFILTLCFVIGAGLALGSFAGALVYRFDHGLPFAWDKRGRPVRSMCPPCGRALTVLELIPVLSWAIQRGRCRCGKVAIPWTYPAVEIGVLALILILFSLYGLGLQFALRAFVVPFVLAALIVAVRRYNRYPDKKSRGGVRALGKTAFFAGVLATVLFLRV